MYSLYTAWDEDTLSDCLCCIADMCRKPSMRVLEVNHYSRELDDGYYFPVWDTFVVILNRSLHCNPSFTSLKLNMYMSPCYLRAIFSYSLCAHPSLFSWNRSKSFGNLIAATTSYPGGECIIGTHDHDILSHRFLESCPDLLQMQSLHNLHPLLHRALNTELLYIYKASYVLH